MKKQQQNHNHNHFDDNEPLVPFTVVCHNVRQKFNIRLLDYGVADIFWHLSQENNDEMILYDIADFFQISRMGLCKIIKKLIRIGVIKKNINNKGWQTTDLWNKTMQEEENTIKLLNYEQVPLSHKEWIKSWNNWYHFNRKPNQEKIKSKLSVLVLNAIRNNKDIDFIGMPIKLFKNYITQKFKKGMTWENHGCWHLDHIRPCVSFDLSKSEEQRKCFHWSNYQPLWAVDNLRKGSKIIDKKD